MMKNAETGIPYEGAKEHYILDVEHEESMRTVIRTLEKVLPYSKKRTKSC